MKRVFRIPYSVFLMVAMALATSAAAQGGVVEVKVPVQNKDAVVATNGMVITTNSAVCKSITAQNSSGGDLWLLIFDRSTNAIPPNGSVPTLAPVKIAAGDTRSWDWGPAGRNFRNGIIVANSTTDRALTNSSANFWFSVSYDGRKE